jgi:hypothetical protein
MVNKIYRRKNDILTFIIEKISETEGDRLYKESQIKGFDKEIKLIL